MMFTKNKKGCFYDKTRTMEVAATAGIGSCRTGTAFRVAARSNASNNTQAIFTPYEATIRRRRLAQDCTASNL